MADETDLEGNLRIGRERRAIHLQKIKEMCLCLMMALDSDPITAEIILLNQLDLLKTEIKKIEKEIEEEK